MYSLIIIIIILIIVGIRDHARFIEIPGISGEGKARELVLYNCPSVMAGYLFDEVSTAEVFKEPNHFHTYDLFEEIKPGTNYNLS